MNYLERLTGLIIFGVAILIVGGWAGVLLIIGLSESKAFCRFYAAIGVTTATCLGLWLHSERYFTGSTPKQTVLAALMACVGLVGFVLATTAIYILGMFANFVVGKLQEAP